MPLHIAYIYVRVHVTGRVSILISKSLRAYTIPGKSNAQQSKPQWAGLNVHANLSAIRHVHCSFTTWVHAASINKQLALIALHDAFKSAD